jgi:3-phenylpropionate/trans-cinnamate dioxygenase ferredoxin reductase subunit
MTTDRTFAIVGASLAGAKAAETLRTEGFDGRIVLIGTETEHPYERPPLSKDFLSGNVARDALHVHGSEFYADQNIELWLGQTVQDLDRAAQELVLDDGARLHYDRVLLATGAASRRLKIPGADLDGVLYLRRSRTPRASAAGCILGARSSWSAPAGSVPKLPPRPASAGSM